MEGKSMLIRSIRVERFRSLYDATLQFDDLTALVGPNGCGKSSFLRALDTFYSTTPVIEKDDFYNCDTSEEIVIAVTYTALSDAARDLFGLYLVDGDLTVERVFTWNDASKPIAHYHGARPQHPAFSAIRVLLAQTGQAQGARELYNTLRRQQEYNELAAANSKAAIEEQFTVWETIHQEQCAPMRDDGQFFGFTPVATGLLSRFTRYLFVPAVRDAAMDATEGKGSPLTELMDYIRATIDRHEGVMALREHASQQFEELLASGAQPQLIRHSQELTDILRTYVPDATVEIDWATLGGISIGLPKADTKLCEDGYSARVARTGHGLQRAFILSLLQYLVSIRTAVGDDDEAATMPNLVLGIEEPELYQHPDRQRYIARMLFDLASRNVDGVAVQTQVLYCTHSPLFVGIDRVDKLRLVRKVDGEENCPKVTSVVQTSLNDVAHQLAVLTNARNPATFTGETLRQRTCTLMTPWVNEGFFANVVVLVEGEMDRAAILGMSKALGREMEGNGISVIPCDGKDKLDRPALIFQNLGIQVYLIWDGDNDGRQPMQANRTLLSIVGAPQEDWPATTVADTYACFAVNLETMLRQEIGETLFTTVMERLKQELGIAQNDHAMKNPYFVQQLLAQAQEAGHECRTLRSIVEKIWALRYQRQLVPA